MSPLLHVGIELLAAGATFAGWLLLCDRIGRKLGGPGGFW